VQVAIFIPVLIDFSRCRRTEQDGGQKQKTNAAEHLLHGIFSQAAFSSERRARRRAPWHQTGA
jgi:hypothetical protein